MTEIDLYNLKGQKTGTTKVPDHLVAQPKAALLAQSVYVSLNNLRRGLAKAQTRGESGKTTAKMYRQKHTGRARHGSKSAPIFVGGGVAHGPTGNQNYSRALPQKMKKVALSQAITAKINQKSVIVVDQLEKVEPKTKAGQKLLHDLGLKDKKIVICPQLKSDTVSRAFGNLPNVFLVPFSNLNSYQILVSDNLVLSSTVLGQQDKAKLEKETLSVASRHSVKASTTRPAQKETTSKTKSKTK